MLRESSLRPDLNGLLDALKEAPALVSRLMLTCDGSMPAFLRAHGFVDHLLRVVLERGVAPVDAYRMATLNPATYFGLDGDLGGIAPGRYADVCLLDDLAEPRPAAVVARGRLVASDGRLRTRVAELAWSRVFTSAEARLTVGWRARAADFALPARPRYPVIRLVSAVISRLEERPLGPGDLRAALLDRGGRWVAPGIVAGFADRLDGLAATISTDFNIVTLGRSPEAMARAVNRLLELHGGVVVVDGADVAYELPLPLGGVMTRGSVEEAADREGELRAVLAFPLRSRWWGGFILAIAEAGIVGGLADWFAVTALFRRPLGLPIPHTALIPANWELMAARVGTMVGSRVLTREYVTQEIEGVDLAGLLARGAERVTRRDLEALTLTLGRWAAAELTPRAAGDLAVRLRDRLLGRPTAPLLAGVLEVACRRGLDQRAITALARTLGDALDRPAFREVVGEAVDDVLARYRERMGAYPRFWMAVASLLGLIDRERVVAALHAGLRQVAADPDHPVRQRPAGDRR